MPQEAQQPIEEQGGLSVAPGFAGKLGDARRRRRLAIPFGWKEVRDQDRAAQHADRVDHIVDREDLVAVIVKIGGLTDSRTVFRLGLTLAMKSPRPTR